MKALSVRQPFAARIVAGLKKVEFRSWTTNYRGPLLIHASSSRAELDGPAEGLAFGAFVGSVELIGCESDGDGCFRWLLASPRELPEPISCPGQTGLFVPPPAILARLREALSRPS